jgi:hypothetical protein
MFGFGRGYGILMQDECCGILGGGGSFSWGKMCFRVFTTAVTQSPASKADKFGNTTIVGAT